MQQTEQQRAFHEDGVVLLPQALKPDEMAAALDCYQWSLEHPTSSACEFYADEVGRFYQDLCHSEAALSYRELLENAGLVDLIGQLWGTEEVWFLYEQVFLKEGPASRRTPWHQDAPYLCVDGEQLAVAWINFDPVDAAHTLEFVRGSHRQTLYDGSSFDETDDTRPIYNHGLPRLPDIEAERDQWDIVSYAVTPGDVVVFHPAMLHGGAATSNGVRRRTLSLRFFGPDAVFVDRPEPAPAPLTLGLHDKLKAGDRFRHPAFPRLRPTPQGFDQIPRTATTHAAPLKHQIQSS